MPPRNCINVIFWGIDNHVHRYSYVRLPRFRVLIHLMLIDIIIQWSSTMSAIYYLLQTNICLWCDFNWLITSATNYYGNKFVVNSLKNNTNKILDVWSKIIKQPKKVGGSYKHKQKYKTTSKRKREHTKFVYPVRSNTDLVWRREQLSVPL